MRFDVISIFPQMFDVIRDAGVIGRAINQGLVSLQVWNPRDFSDNKHRSIDDRPYGGGPGMVMQAEPLAKAIAAARAQQPADIRVIYLSPQGRKLDHGGVIELTKRPGMILLSGRYEGIDERLLASEVDEEWSIGDYVLSGGELATMVMMDAVIRQLPGVLGDEDSAQADSFVNGLLDFPHYSRPEMFRDMAVPEVLLSGDHAAIERWRMKQSLGRTWLRRPDLLQRLQLNTLQQQLLDEFIQEYQDLTQE